jgi:exodeoxyribonuclease-3
VRVVSWNVNGIRACARKGFRAWLARAGADVVALQEVRALPEEAAAVVPRDGRWHATWVAAERRGYSGVALLARRAPDATWTGLGVPRFDREGRLVAARWGRLAVVNGYFPKGSGRRRDNSRVPYKLAFYRAARSFADGLRRAGLRVLVVGDLNTAHREIDLARPRENAGTSGFLPVERAALDAWLAAGWVDTFRRFEPGPGHYSWWSQRRGVRARNVGWRIDYVLASRGATPWVRDAFIVPTVRGSDHCPVGVDLDPAVTGREPPASAP